MKDKSVERKDNGNGRSKPECFIISTDTKRVTVRQSLLWPLTEKIPGVRSTGKF